MSGSISLLMQAFELKNVGYHISLPELLPIYENYEVVF